MDHIETEPLHLVRDKNFIDKYLNLMIRKELEIDINVSNEYVIAQNIVSRKSILVRTFSNVVMDDPQLYFLLTSLIQSINTRTMTRSQIITALEEK